MRRHVEQCNASANSSQVLTASSRHLEVGVKKVWPGTVNFVMASNCGYFQRGGYFQKGGYF